MKLYKLIVESWGEILSEDLYVNKDRAVKDALNWIDKRPYFVDKIDVNKVTIEDLNWSIRFYTEKGTEVSDVYIDVVETVD